MLKLLLKPGIQIINQLSIVKKFVLIFILYLIPVAYIGHYAVTKHQKAITATQNEIQALKLINLFKPVFINIAKSRGLTNAWLNGNTSAQKKLQQTYANVDNQLQTILANKIYLSSLSDKTRSEFNDIKQQWQQLKSNAQQLSAEESFTQHSMLIKKVHTLILSIMELSPLLTDSEVHTSFLIRTFVEEIPKIIEVTGQTRGMGAGIAAKKSFSSDTFIGLSNYYKQLILIKQSLSHSFISALGIDQSLSVLESVHQDAERKLSEFLDVTKNKLLDPETIQVSSDEYFSLGTQVIQLSSLLFDKTYQEIQIALEKREANIKFEVLINISSSLLLVLSAIYLFASFYYGMLDSITRIETCVNTVADGDLTTNIEIQSNDEMKHIGSNINRMIEHTKALVNKVHLATNDLVETASDNNRSASATSERIYQQNVEVEQVATAMNEMSATVQEVAANAEQTAQSTASADRDAKAGYQILQSSIRSINELADELEGASDSINDLQNNVKGISSVLDVIQGIADQTNLLALNAAIEAARAGESGRGFAVVADEVRTLASKTQESTEEIRQMIQKLQESASHSVKAMLSGNEKSQKTVVDAQDAGKALKQISESVGHISLMGEQIASASTQQSSVAEEINKSIMSVKDISELTGQSAKDSAENSQFLDTVAKNLKELLAKFKT